MAKAARYAVLIALGLLWTLFAGQASLAGDTHRYVKPGSRAAGLAACVEPTVYMRRHHMELIKHQRDATVRHGIRGTPHSLAGCIDCHVSHDAQDRAVAINGPDQFCGACHAFTAVDVNCFGCHAAVPRGEPLSEAALATAGSTAARSGPSARPQAGPATPVIARGEAR